MISDRAEYLKGLAAYVRLWRHFVPDGGRSVEERLVPVIPALEFAAGYQVTEEEARWVVRHSRPRKQKRRVEPE